MEGRSCAARVPFVLDLEALIRKRMAQAFTPLSASATAFRFAAGRRQKQWPGSTSVAELLAVGRPTRLATRLAMRSER
jgi:hypothetical protein